MRTEAANGWQFFVATLLIVLGAINIIQGLVALFSPAFYTVGVAMPFLEYGSWGILLGLWGAALVVAGLAVLSRSTWARAFGVVLAALNILAQLAFAMAMPLWSMVAIAIGVVVIYGLTAGWPTATSTASGREDDEAIYRSGYQASHGRSAHTPRQAEAPEQRTGGREQNAGY